MRFILIVCLFVHLYSLSLFSFVSTQAIGVPCVNTTVCPFQNGCVNNTATGEHICICRLEHMTDDGLSWRENFTACTTDYSPWSISSYEDGVKVEPPKYVYERVPNKAMRASGSSDGYAAAYGRLLENTGKGAWCAPSDTNTQLLQIDLGVVSEVKMIATQGRADSKSPFLVKSYKIQHAKSLNERFKYYENGTGKAVTLTGNSNNDDIVYNFFNPPIVAKLINIEPITFERLRCLRVEVYGRKRIDECTHDWGKCDKSAQCNDTVASYSCTCPAGWDDVNNDGTECVKVNECTDTREGWKNNCHKDAICKDTPNSFTCGCKPGYQGDGYYCEDVNECEEDKLNECLRPTAACTNTIGAYTCACKSGYKGDGITSCLDINECKKAHDCHTNAKCTNKQGTFECDCLQGYEGNGRSCKDINECTRWKPCHSKAYCTNKIGTFVCTCVKGYRGSGLWCSDIDECTEGSALCKPTEKCYNLAGTYECMCPRHIPLQGRYINKTEISILDKLLLNIRDVSLQDWQYSIYYHARIIRDVYNLVKLTYKYHFKETRDSFFITTVNGDAFGVELYDFRCTEVVNLSFPNLCHETYDNTRFKEFTDIVEMSLIDEPTRVFDAWATTPAPTPPLPGRTTPTPDPIFTLRPLTTKILYLNGTNVTLTERPRTTPTPFTECGEYITKPPGDDGIESPSSKIFDDRYPSNARCVWTIVAPKEHDVYIEFTDFILEYDPKCVYDYVKIYDDSLEGELLGRFCGNRTITPVVPIRSGHGTLVIVFETDNSQEFFGFTFIYKFLNPRAAIICISYNLMSTLPDIYREQWRKELKKEDKSMYAPVSRLIACKQYPKCMVTRPNNMRFTFEHFRYDRNEKKCVHWPIDVPGAYHSHRPCWQVKTNMTHTICECHTWGIVTVLGRTTNVSNHGRYTRYELGRNCFLSVLLVTIVLVITLVYLFLKDQWASAMYEVFTRKEYDSGRLIQMHILLQTLLVEFFFLVITFDVEANVGVCYFFALLFYYLVQTVFFWLFVYSLFLQTRLKEIFDSSKYNSYKIYLFIGYGVPFVVMLTISGLEFQEANKGVCWLLFQGTTVWGFSGVIVTLGVISLIFLIHVVYEARKMEYGAILQEKCLRTMFTTFFILLTSVFGTLALQERNYFYEWCFSLCNIMQGFSITIMYCILRREDSIIRANQIGVLPRKKGEDEEDDDELQQFQCDDDEVTFADMPHESEDEDIEEDDINSKLKELAKIPPSEVPRRERIVRFDEEEVDENLNEETAVDEPLVEDSDTSEDNEMEFMELEPEGYM